MTRAIGTRGLQDTRLAEGSKQMIKFYNACGKFVIKAPKGGIVNHPANGRDYRGGQFCPLFPVAGGSDEAKAKTQTVAVVSNRPPRNLRPISFDRVVAENSAGFDAEMTGQVAALNGDGEWTILPIRLVRHYRMDLAQPGKTTERYRVVSLAGVAADQLASLLPIQEKTHEAITALESIRDLVFASRPDCVAISATLQHAGDAACMIHGTRVDFHWAMT